MKFHYINSDDGLSENWVQSFCRDHNDYMWIGTTYGLNKFDGYKITIYEYDENLSGSISNNNIRCIFEDSKNNLWVGTGDGLNLYNPTSDNFTVFRNDSTDINSLQGNFVTCITEDKNGNVWITGMNGSGMQKWVPEKNNFISYRIKDTDSSLINNSLTTMCLDADNKIWTAGRGLGIYCFDPNAGNFIHYNDTTMDTGPNTEKEIYADNDGKVWFTATLLGLFSFDIATSKFENFGINVGNKGLSGNSTHDIIAQDNRYLLIAVDQGGINRFDKITKEFEYITYDEFNEQGLNTDGVISLYKDQEGILWVGTTRGGVNYYNLKLDRFKLFRHSQDPNSLPHNFVSYLYEDSEGLIWVCTNGGGISVYDPQSDNFTNYKHDPNDIYSISGNAIRCVTEDKDHNIWIGTWKAGLNRFDKKTKRFYPYYNYTKVPSGFSIPEDNIIWTIKTDRNNNMWLGGYHGAIIGNISNGIVKRLRVQPDNPNSLCSNLIISFYEDYQKNMWICTAAGLNFYNFKNDSLTAYKNFPDNTIQAFCKDKYGKLWAGSASQGLFLFEPDGTILKTYDKTNGLSGNSIRAIIDDNNGDLWITTNRGLTHFKQENQEFSNYFKNDGLQGNNFYSHSVLKTREGELYIGGYKGFNSFYPDSIKDNDFIPQVHITSFKIFNEEVQFGTSQSPLQNHITETKEITLLWNQSVFSFGFTAINYTSPEKNQYAYMMEGFEEKWNYVGNRREATYTNLDPGEYVFKVIASNNDGIWNREGAEIKIIIAPPFYKTWLFKSILILLLLSILTFTILRIINNIKSRANQTILNEQNQLKTLIDNIPDRIIIKDTKSRFVIVNKAMLQSLNAKNEKELVNKTDYDLHSKDLADAFFKEEQQIVKTGVAVINEESERMEGDRKRIVSTTKCPIINTKGDIIGLVCIIKDITEEKLIKLELKNYNEELSEINIKLEENQEEINIQNEELNRHREGLEKLVEERTAELLIAKEKAEESDRLKSAFLANMSHEIRTPMNAIVGFSNMLSEEDVSKEQQEKFIGIIINNSSALLTLINDILDISKIEANQLIVENSTFCVDDIIKELYDYYQLKNKEIKDVELFLKIPENKTKTLLHSDPIRVKQIFINLLDNAFKYTEKGKIEFGYTIEQDFLKFFVSDTGVGISDKEKANIFNYFYKIELNKRKFYRGTGIGLSICKKLAEMLGGNLWVENNNNKGSIFYLKMPKNKENYSQGIVQIRESDSEISLNGMNILIAEDVLNNYELIEAILVKHGANLIWAQNGREAIDCISNHLVNKNFLILMDIKMPVLDGIEACKIIKEMRREIPIIAITAFAQKGDKENLIKIGFDDYISKPIIPKDLIKIIAGYYPVSQ